MTNENKKKKKKLNYKMFIKFQLLYLKIIAQNRLCVSTTKPSMLRSTEGLLA